MDTPSRKTRRNSERVPAQRTVPDFIRLWWTPAVLCIPLMVIGVAGLWFALRLSYTYCAAAHDKWPMLREALSETDVLWILVALVVFWGPRILMALAVFFGLSSACFVAASLVGLRFREGWAIRVLRKAYVLFYALFAFYAYVVLSVIGQVNQILTDWGEPVSGLQMFQWGWQLLWPAGCLLLVVVVLHVLSWRWAALKTYGGPDKPPITAVLCLPLGMIGAAGLWFALSLPEVCYPAAYAKWPLLGEAFSKTNMPPILMALAVFCGLSSVCFVVASLLALLFQKGWAIWGLRKAYVLFYALIVFYAYVALNVIGQVYEKLTNKPEPASGMELQMFQWKWQLLWPAGCLLLAVIVLHIVSWRRVALVAYGGPEEEEPAAGDKIVENIRTNGRDPAFRKTVYGSALVHLMVIIVIPLLLSAFRGCIRPYHIPLGSGNPAVAKMIVVKKKKKKKKRKRYILAKNAPIIFKPPDLDKDSELIKEVEEATQLHYAANTNAAHGAMGTGGGNKPGWADGFADGEVRFIRLEYGGTNWDDGMDPSTSADVNFLKKFREYAGGIKTATKSESHPISYLRQYPKGEAPPFVYMTGSRDIRTSQSDIKALREYLQGGGMLFADCGSHHWNASFRSFIRSVFPGNPLREIADDDPIFQIPFTFQNGPPPLWHHGGERAMGVKYKNRWCVFYFPGDLNDAWKTGHSGIDSELAERAFELGSNIVYYSFTKYLQETRKYRK